MKKHINIITMGCSKNLVDSEHLMRQLERKGWQVVHDAPEDAAEVVVVNTCGFVHDARQESVDMILSCVDAKARGLVRKVFVMGCLSELYKKELADEIPEVDGFVGARGLDGILRLLDCEYSSDLACERIVSTPRHYAYLKIAEGCNRMCAFCSIPFIRGKHQSVAMENLITEAKFLASEGARELLVISQDPTYYGVDLYDKQMLPQLVESLSSVDGIDWIRLHYTYPNDFPKSIVEQMKAEHDRKLCRYIDMPIQHIADDVLKMMKRNIDGQTIKNLIGEIRADVPNVALRTSLIVGHPGETPSDFDKLLRFVEDTKFDRLGVFTYSHEDKTYAGRNYSDDISEEEKQHRADLVMDIQSRISEELNSQKINTVQKVLIDRIEGEYYVGRTEFDSPEVDNEVLINKNENLEIGNFYDVHINDSTEFDLFGTTIK